jgi:hypothetical protein
VELAGISRLFRAATFHLWCFTSIGDFVVILLGTQQVNSQLAAGEDAEGER